MTLLPNRGEILAAVHALVDEWVEAARPYGTLPPVTSVAFLAAEPAQQLAALLVLAEAWLAQDPHQVIRAVMRQTADDVHGGDPAFWRRMADLHRAVEYRRRAAA